MTPRTAIPEELRYLARLYGEGLVAEWVVLGEGWAKSEQPRHPAQPRIPNFPRDGHHVIKRRSTGREVRVREHRTFTRRPGLCGVCREVVAPEPVAGSPTSPAMATTSSSGGIALTSHLLPNGKPHDGDELSLEELAHVRRRRRRREVDAPPLEVVI